MYFADIVIHIDETLDDVHVSGLERVLGREKGVYEANVHKESRHLLFVDFDPDRVEPMHIVRSVRAQGLHAEMIHL